MGKFIDLSQAFQKRKGDLGRECIYPVLSLCSLVGKNLVVQGKSTALNNTRKRYNTVWSAQTQARA